MPAPYRFRPRALPTAAAVVGIAATLALAHWQLGRAQEKQAARAQLEERMRAPVILTATEVKAQDVQWHRVTVRGRFNPRHAVFIDNRIYRGIPGYHVVMPLELGKMRGGGSLYVLVNRGWIAGTRDRGRLPQVKTPEETVEVTGLAVVPGGRFLELGRDTVEGNVWQNLTLERYRRAVPIALQPVMIQQESALDDGLVRAWDKPDLGMEKHYGYAFQWLALAVTILIIYLVTNVKGAKSS